jgi:hypothetical protein
MKLCDRREKVFGPGRTVPLDRNAKARIATYARAWSTRNSRGNTKAQSPAPSWMFCRRCCGSSIIAVTDAAFPATSVSPRSQNAPEALWPRH